MTGHQDFDQLRAALRIVAEDDERFGASAAVAARLRGELELTRRARRVATMKLYAAAAVLLATVSGAVWSIGGPPAARPAARVEDPAPEQTTPFFALHYSSVPAPEAQIVRMEVPRAALARFGLGGGDTPVNDASATVLADVIVGSDGLARAIRFVGIEEPRQ
jgi:hypothetical protein